MFNATNIPFCSAHPVEKRGPSRGLGIFSKWIPAFAGMSGFMEFGDMK